MHSIVSIDPVYVKRMARLENLEQNRLQGFLSLRTEITKMGRKSSKMDVFELLKSQNVGNVMGFQT